MNIYPTAEELRRIADEHCKLLFAETQEKEWQALWELIQSSAIAGKYQCSMRVARRTVQEAQSIWGASLNKLQNLGFEAYYIASDAHSDGYIQVSWAGNDQYDQFILYGRF